MSIPVSPNPTGAHAAPPPLAAGDSRRSAGIDWAPIFGYDIFVSYNWTDARPYAARLEADLRMHDLRCFLDNTDAPPGTALNSTLQAALRRSRVLVLLVSRRALQSQWVTEEVKTFAKTGRAIIPVNLDGSVTSTDAANAILTVLKQRDCIWIDDLTVDAIAPAPATTTVDGIRRSFRYRRANTMRRQVTAAAFLILLATTLVALWQWRQSRAQVVELQGRQLLIQAQNLQREQPGRIEPISLLALESQMRSPSPEAMELMRQSLETLAEPPSKSIPLASKNALWAINPSEKSATLLDGATVRLVALPSGEVRKTFDIEAGAPSSDPEGPPTPVVAVSPDGSAVGVWNHKKEVIIWDVASGRERWRGGVPQKVASLTLSDRGNVFVVATAGQESLEQSLQVFRCKATDCAPRDWPASVKEGNTLGLEGTIERYSLSRDGNRLSALRKAGCGSSYNCESIYVFDTASGQLVSTSDYLLNRVTATDFSNSFPAFAVRMGQNLYVTIKGKRVEVPSGVNADQIRFSETGRTVATSSRDGVRVYDVEALHASATRTKGDIADDEVYISPLQPVAFIARAGGESLVAVRDGGMVPEGCELLTADASAVLTQWNCASGQAGLRIPQTGEVKTAAVFAQGRQIVTQTEREWQIRPVNPSVLQMEHRGRRLELSGDTFTLPEGPQNPVNLSADGKRAAVCVSNALWLWDLQSGRLISRVDADQGTYSTCRLAAGGSHLLAKTAMEHARVWLGLESVALGQQLGAPVRSQLINGETTAVPGWNYSWVTSPTLPQLYLVDQFAAVTALDVAHPKETMSWADSGAAGTPFQGRQTAQAEETGHQLAVSADGERLGLLRGGTLRTWAAKTPGRAPLADQQVGAKATGLVFAPNHSVLAVGVEPKVVSVRNADTGTQTGSVHLDTAPEAFEFDPSGTFLGVRTKGLVQLFNARTGKLVRALKLPNASPVAPFPGRPLVGLFHERQFVGFDGQALVGVDLPSGTTAWSRPVKGMPPFALMGQRVAIVEEESYVSIYPPADGARLAQVRHSSPILAVEGIGADRLLFWGGSKIQVYQLSENPGPTLANRLTRALTPQEWQTYLGGESWRDTRAAYRNPSGGWWRWLWPSAN